MAPTCSGPWPAGRGLLQTIAEASGLARSNRLALGRVREPPAPGMGQRHRPPQPIRRKTSSAWPALAVLALVMATLAILLVNQNQSGDPLKVRRELRKF